MSKPIVNDYAEQCKLIDPSKTIRVYRNLNRTVDGQHGFWSVKQGSTVRLHCQHIFVKDAKFVVSESGRQKVLAERRKRVHAFVVGYLADTPTYFTVGQDCAEVYYNPYEHSTFVVGQTPIYEASMVCLTKMNKKMKVLADWSSVRYAKNKAWKNYWESKDSNLDTVIDCDMIRESVQLHLL